jgi:hypothetical protein
MKSKIINAQLPSQVKEGWQSLDTSFPLPVYDNLNHRRDTKWNNQ